MHYFKIFLLILLIILAPVSKLIAYNQLYFDLSTIEIIISVIVFSCILSFPFLVLSIIKSTRKWIHLLLIILLVSTVIMTFFTPINLSIVDAGETDFELRKESTYALYISFFIFLLSFVLFIARDNLFKKFIYFTKILKLFSCIYIISFFTYSILTGPLSFSFSGEQTKVIAPISQEDNIFLIGFDQIQGSFMEGYLNANPDTKELLQGFTFYPDVASTYPNTNYSLSSLVQGSIVNDSSESFGNMISNDNSILSIVDRNGYSILTNDLSNDDSFENIIKTEAKKLNFQESYELLRYSMNISFGVDISSIIPDRIESILLTIPPYVSHPELRDLTEFDEILENISVSSNEPTFYTMFFKGTHQPFIYDQDCATKTESDIEVSQNFQGASDTIACFFNKLQTLIETLKTLGVYDESTIIIFSDHGYESNINSIENQNNYSEYFPVGSSAIGDARNIKPAGSYNPILFFKPSGASSDFSVDYSPVSLIDIAPTICEIIGYEQEWQGVSLFNSVTQDREREYWFYLGGSDVSDKYHYYLLPYWERRSFFGSIHPNLALSMGASEEQLLKIYSIGDTIEFKENGNGQYYIVSGWSEQEKEFRWSDGKTAILEFRIDEKYENDYLLSIFAHAYLGGGLNYQSVDVIANGNKLTTWQIINREWYRVEIPASYLNQNDYLILEFIISEPTSPYSVGESNDRRELGFAIYELIINETE